MVIADHGPGWPTLLTNPPALEVAVGDRVEAGALLGRAGAAETGVTVELRRNGQPFPIAPLLALAG